MQVFAGTICQQKLSILPTLNIQEGMFWNHPAFSDVSAIKVEKYSCSKARFEPAHFFREVPANWWTLFLFSRRARRRSLETTDLLVSLQYLLKLWRRLFCEILKILERQCNHWSQPAWHNERRVLLIKSNFFLWQENPPIWPKETSWSNLLGFQ